MPTVKTDQFKDTLCYTPTNSRVRLSPYAVRITRDEVVTSFVEASVQLPKPINDDSVFFGNALAGIACGMCFSDGLEQLLG
jgi:hypothetical protein